MSTELFSTKGLVVSYYSRKQLHHRLVTHIYLFTHKIHVFTDTYKRMTPNNIVCLAFRILRCFGSFYVHNLRVFIGMNVLNRLAELKL